MSTVIALKTNNRAKDSSLHKYDNNVLSLSDYKKNISYDSRKHIALTTKCQDTLTVLAFCKISYVRMSCLDNPSMTADMMEYMYKSDPDFTVRMYALQKLNAVQKELILWGVK